MNPQLFPSTAGYHHSYTIFKNTPLGSLHSSIPWEEMEKLIEKNSKEGLPRHKSKAGRKSRFSIKGGLALNFLKHYLGLSDRKLIARINSDWQLQYFCFIMISYEEPIKDKDIVGRWRRFIGENLVLETMQAVFISKWTPYMKNTHVKMDDATCYESYVKYPTDVKLLYDCTSYLYKEIECFYTQVL